MKNDFVKIKKSLKQGWLEYTDDPHHVVVTYGQMIGHYIVADYVLLAEQAFRIATLNGMPHIFTVVAWTPTDMFT